MVRVSVYRASPLWFHIVLFRWSPLLCHSSPAAGEKNVWLLPGLISSYVRCHQTVWHIQNPHQHHSQQAYGLWPVGSDCTDRRAPSVGAGIQLKTIKPFSSFIFIPTTALLSPRYSPFFLSEIASLRLKGSRAEAVGRSDPGALRGWLKNKLISGPIDGGQAGKYHGKLNYRDSWERRHWPALINSM